MRRAQYTQRGRSNGRGYLPAPVQMRTRDTRRLVELNRAFEGYCRDAEPVSLAEMPVVKRRDTKLRVQRPSLRRLWVHDRDLILNKKPLVSVGADDACEI